MYHHLRTSLVRRSHLGIFCDRELSTSVLNNQRINKVLIANRGEIACRIQKTAKKLGVKTVAIYSDADANSMHVTCADEAYHVGPPPSAESYLRQEEIINIAKKAKCQAIHPGYGFLSENMEFADLCRKRDVIFIGPPASAIRDMGIKSTSKEIMSRAGVPIIQGYHSSDQSDEKLLEEARKIGFPVMIKAVRGGGGKGMRIASEEKVFLEALESARTESQKAFGDSDVLLEKYVQNPRHVEVQIFADSHGNAVYLFERDCSVQRRHQKVIEEAPAPGLTDAIRKEIGEAAVRAAKAVGYVGAGTVEFIYDRTDQSFYFMEMNTRLQVEHPVTEAITGLDLVEWQLNIAAGEKLPLTQEEIKLNGHAFEARIYAEDPRGGFLPRAGPLHYLSPPENAKNIRVETGVRQGDEVSVHYDPMIAKLVVWGNNRAEALDILRTKLSEYKIAGVETNIEFIKDLCRHPKFQSADVHTGFIDENLDSLFPKLYVPPQILAQGALGLILSEDLATFRTASDSKDPFSPFNTEIGLRLNHVLKKRFQLKFGEKTHVVDVQYAEPDVYLMRIDDNGPWRRVEGTLAETEADLELRSEVEGVRSKSCIWRVGDELHIFTNDRTWKLTIPKPSFIEKLSKSTANLVNAAVSPMPGVVDKILVSKSDIVKKGDPLVVIVAMKMEYVIRAPSSGTVEEILCSVGSTVSKDKLLVKMSENQTETES